MDDTVGEGRGYSRDQINERDQHAMLAKRENSAQGSRTIKGEPGRLDQITERIMHLSRQVREIGFKLNEHADAVFGQIPANGRSAPDCTDKPSAALDRVHCALDELEESVSINAQAAGRNSTLA